MMPFEIQKNNSSIETSPSIKGNNKNEIDLVNKRVVKTKQEIEHLKLELQKLIDTGLCSENENPTKANVKQTEQLSCDGQQPSVNKNCDIDKKYVNAQRENVLLKYKKTSYNLSKMNQVPSNITTRFNYISLRQCHVSNNENNKIDCQKNKVEYNKEKAREYIKKQREKRAEQMKAKIKETQNEIDLRKKKLKELHEKSLQLVSKNVKQKRKKCQTCEKKNTTSETKQSSNCQNNVELMPGDSNTVICNIDKSSCNFNSEDNKLSACNLSNNYKTKKETKNELRYDLNRKVNGLTQFNSHRNADTGQSESNNVNRDELLYEAATKIQACFRGFRERKLYKNVLSLQKNENNLEKSKYAWLEVPTTLPYPYNFINAVKKKISYAVSKKNNNEKRDFSEFSKSKENIGVSDQLEIKRSSENSTSKPKPVPPMIEDSEYHPLFDDEKAESNINQEKGVISNSKEIQPSNGTWRNIDISCAQPLDPHVNLSKETINRTKSNNDRCDLKSFLSDKCLDLNLQNIQSLSLKPLQIDSQYFNKNTNKECTSDSDTSKNIPDISTESSVNTRLSKQVHSSNISDSLDKTDDYNLEYNHERHNNLRRSRRRKLKKTDDETIQTNYSSQGQRKPLPLTNIISHGNVSNDYNYSQEVEEITCNTDASYSEKEDLGNNTKMLSSFLSYMQCLGVETSTKPNVENEIVLERNKTTTASLFNSKRKEGKQMNLTDNQPEINQDKYSSDFESLSVDKLNFVPSLKCPSMTLNTSHVSLHKSSDQVAHLQVPFNQTVDTKINSNEIHLKFEAEIRLLHHFNKSLQEAVEKEKSLLENHYVPNNKNDGGDEDDDKVIKGKSRNSKAKGNARIGSINYSRGSDVLRSYEPACAISSTSDMFENNFFSKSNFDLKDINESDVLDQNDSDSSSTMMTLKKRHEDYLYPGLSLGMFDQLIKDEDVRIENLKTILKIREKSLLDRTKSELAWLEIQKRYLKDSGQLNEISMIKKKQRGLLVKLQHERHEMQRLKQMQKAASKERKTRLRQQRNMIKAQLSSNSETMGKLKSSLSRERRHSFGPLKVIGVYRYNESIMSQTSPFPKKGFSGTNDNEMISLSDDSSQSVANTLLTDRIVTCSNSDLRVSNDSGPKQRNQNEHLKRSLLMRETALLKRRKVAEELLQWHQRLVEEERQIAELESAANSIISQVTTNPYVSDQNGSSSPNFAFKGRQLNVMWQNMTGRQGQRFNDNELYIMSNEGIQQYYKDVKKSNQDNNLIKVDSSNVSTEIAVGIHLQNQEQDENGQLNFLSISSSANPTRSEEITEEIVGNTSSSVIEHVDNIPNETRKTDDSNQTSYSEDFEDSCLNANANFVSKQNIIQLECIPHQNINICYKNPSSTVDINGLKTVAVTPDISVSVQIESIENKEEHIISELEKECFEINTETNVPVDNGISNQDNTITENNSHTLNEIASLSAQNAIENIDTSIGSLKYISACALTSNLSNCEEENGNPFEHLSINKEFKNIKTSIPDVINKASDYESQNTASNSSSIVQNKLTTESEVVQVSKITEMPDILYKTCTYEEKNTPSTISENIFKDEKGDLSASEVDFSLAFPSEHNLQSNKDLSDSKNSNDIYESSSDVVVNNCEQEISTTINKHDTIKTEKSEIDFEFGRNNTAMNNANVTKHYEPSSIFTDILKQKNGEDEIEKEILSSNQFLGLNEVSTKDEINRKETNNMVKSDDDMNISGTKNDLEKESCHNNSQNRIFEISTDATVSRNEPNLKLHKMHQSPYNTTSSSPVIPSESEILLLDKQVLSKHPFATEEEEELVKKQLAIEQEIKQIEQQQKEHLPYLYLREIPNKPPPPYMPPAPISTFTSVLPSSAEQVNLIVHHISNYLFNAHLNGTLPNISLLPEIKRQMQGQIEPACQTFVFDLCKELTVEHYKQFEQDPTGPSWMRITKRPKLAFQKAFDERTLEKFLMKKVKETLGYEKIDRKESMIIKWSRKRRDHVDELLVLESQNEEAEWTNYDKDELIVINELTNEIVNSLIDETARILQDILLAKRRIASASPN